MKTLVKKNSNVSIYLFDDGEYISVETDKVIVGNPVRFIITDCNSTNVNLFENVTDPGDWIGWKYLYTTKNSWELNPNWNPPPE